MRGTSIPSVGAAAAGLMLALGAPAARAAAQSSEQACAEGRPAQGCDEAVRRELLARYGVRSIEAHRDAGDEVRRVFYVDGYGRDAVLIAFVRSPGRDPTAWVHFPPGDGAARPEPLQALVPRSVWSEVISRSWDFDRTFAPRESARTIICLHGWHYVIEAAERPRGHEPAAIRRKTEDACDDGPGGTFAVEVQRLALPLFPPCAALDSDQHRNAASMLAACRMLTGDRLVAAEVMNLAGVLRRVSTREEAGLMHGAFDHRATIDWNGARNRGDRSALAFWLERVFAEDRPSFFVRSVHGENADRAALSAVLSRPVGGDEDGDELAEVEQLWVRDGTGVMRIERATVGPWRRHSPD